MYKPPIGSKRGQFQIYWKGKLKWPIDYFHNKYII